MFARLKLITIIFAVFPAVYLLLYGTLPVAVSAMYGGNPPSHIARLLDKQMESFQEVSRLIFSPISALLKDESKVARSDQ
jgi:hypothetical protein